MARKTFYNDLEGENIRPITIGGEQKSTTDMNTLVDKYSQPSSLFYRPWDGSFGTTRDMLSLPLHPWFIQ